jgi:uncharacterized lipoprotein YajG
VKRLFMHTSLVFGAVLILSSAAGCTGKSKLRYLDLQTKPPAAASTEMEPVTIVIEPFEDRRKDKARVGTRSHLWGGVTHFDVVGGRPADVISQALVNRLKSRGWGNKAWNVRLGQAGSAVDADIVISGQVQEFFANAKSRPFSTVIDAKNRFTIQAKNATDKSTTTRNIEGAEGRLVFWFNEEDVQDLLAATLNDGIERFITDTMIVQKALRPVQ